MLVSVSRITKSLNNSFLKMNDSYLSRDGVKEFYNVYFTEGERLFLNPDCRSRVLCEYIKEKCDVEKDGRQKITFLKCLHLHNVNLMILFKMHFQLS